jgi:hypothetical protein
LGRWFNTFADSETTVELTAAADLRTRHAAVVLRQHGRAAPHDRRYLDIVFADDMPEFKPRTTPSGKTLLEPDVTDAERKELTDGAPTSRSAARTRRSLTTWGKWRPSSSRRS